MARKLAFTRSARKAIVDLEPKFFKQVVSKIISLTLDPAPQDSLKLSGAEGLYRVNQGEFRIVYRYDEETVNIAVVGKRNDDEVYRDTRHRQRESG